MEKIQEQPSVTILVPIYNVEKWIEKCARSAFEQTYENLEYVFVDDCSPDKSVEILQRVVADYPHRAAKVRILHHDHNRGLASTRNTLVDACTTEFLFHLDSDDWIEPNAIELLVKNQLETGSDIVTGEALLFKDGKEEPYLSRFNNKDDVLPSLLKLELSHTVWGRLIRTSLYKENNLKCIDGINFGEDYQIVPKLYYLTKRVSGISAFIYHYNRDNVSSYVSRIKGNFELKKQSIVSFEEVNQFFADKEPELQILSKTALILIIKYLLKESALNRDKLGHSFCVKYLQSFDSTLLSIVNWNYPLIRIIDSNYYLMVITLPLRKAGARIIGKMK